jgi:hypothetical protein
MYCHVAALLRMSFWLRLHPRKIRLWAFVSSNSKKLSCKTFLKHKNSRKQELALRHCVNRLVPENAKKCGKVHIKHIRIVTKQAWSIKNYRYVWDVSTSPSLTPARPRVGK